MGARLLIDIKEKDGLSYVKLSGMIDEDNDLLESTHRITQPKVVINTADIHRINSCGVRDWVTWLGDLGKKGANVYLVECSPTIMTQANLVHNFTSSGTILSFYAPYYCSDCDTDKMLLLEMADVFKTTPFVAPACRCDQCDNAMDFDDIENSYFAFLSTAKREAPDETLLSTLKEFKADGNGRLRSRSTAMPLVTSEAIGTPTGSLGTFTPPTPGSLDLAGLISATKDSSLDRSNQIQNTAGPSSTLLYLIVGLLVVAIGIMGYVFIRGFQ
jgi:anti-anti-sigma regulatory factor